MKSSWWRLLGGGNMSTFRDTFLLASKLYKYRGCTQFKWIEWGHDIEMLSQNQRASEDLMIFYNRLGWIHTQDTPKRWFDQEPKGEVIDFSDRGRTISWHSPWVWGEQGCHKNQVHLFSQYMTMISTKGVNFFNIQTRQPSPALFWTVTWQSPVQMAPKATMLYTPDKEHFGIVPVEAMYVGRSQFWFAISLVLVIKRRSFWIPQEEGISNKEFLWFWLGGLGAHKKRWSWIISESRNSTWSSESV